jgi:hypothetical protein
MKKNPPSSKFGSALEGSWEWFCHRSAKTRAPRRAGWSVGALAERSAKKRERGDAGVCHARLEGSASACSFPPGDARSDPRTAQTQGPMPRSNWTYEVRARSGVSKLYRTASLRPQPPPTRARGAASVWSLLRLPREGGVHTLGLARRAAMTFISNPETGYPWHIHSLGSSSARGPKS